MLISYFALMPHSVKKIEKKTMYHVKKDFILLVELNADPFLLLNK